MNRILLLLVLAVAVASPRPAAAAPGARGHAAKAPRVALARAPVDARSRTLDDIHIEGEIPVPQVLFITARDQRRFLEFQHHRYLRTSTQLGEATELPRWIFVTPDPSHAGKEIAR
jgi:hypothetical protein